MDSLALLNQPPDFSSTALLTIEAQAALSMVSQVPGKYFRSQRAPSNDMLYGLLENALGWHFGESDRTRILKHLFKLHKASDSPHASGSGFQSLLQLHVRFGMRFIDEASTMPSYDDYWSQHLRTAGTEFYGGSREHDARLIPLVNATSTKDPDLKVTVTDSGGRKDLDVITQFQPGDKVSLTAIRPYFPRYYVTPVRREYVLPRTAYRYRIETSATIANILKEAVENPQAPLYLGSSDGWVDASLQTLPEVMA